MKKVDIFFIHFLFFIKIYKKELFILFQGIFYFADCIFSYIGVCKKNKMIYIINKRNRNREHNVFSAANPSVWGLNN